MHGGSDLTASPCNIDIPRNPCVHSVQCDHQSRYWSTHHKQSLPLPHVFVSCPEKKPPEQHACSQPLPSLPDTSEAPLGLESYYLIHSSHSLVSHYTVHSYIYRIPIQHDRILQALWHRLYLLFQ